MIQTDHFVGGKRVKAFSQESYTSLNPSNNEAIATFSVGNAQDIDRAVQSAREAFDKGPWPRLPIKERIKILLKFANIIRRESDFLGTLESQDVGKLKEECIRHDVARAAENIAFFAKQMEEWPEETFTGEGKFLGKPVKTRSDVKRLPVGVAGLIIPWNSPIMLGTWKIGPCIATGNTCILKPPPWTSLSCLQLGELANEAGIPAGVINILPGGPEAGEALVRHPSVNRISFTGSVPGGKVVAKANAETRLAPLSLELGGKSPAVVFADCDLDLTIKGVARGIFRSQGQSCVAGSRLLLEQSIYNDFLERLILFAKKMKIGNPLEPSSEIGPLVSREHLQRVEAYIQTGIQEGARLLTGGKRPNDPALSRGNFLEPTIFDQVKPTMKIFREEIFGPVLVVLPFRSEEEAVQLANNSEFGLSSSVWTKDERKAMRVAEALEAGMVWINSHFVRDLRVPFGGVKNSGIGSEGGRYSLEFYTQPKMICLTT
ncbi:MAG: aldehyde dehydrogenase [Deltaproteobacteria bacterium]|nr:aldehyde dehydrogenase [Deltaproteobacteria bacterium]